MSIRTYSCNMPESRSKDHKHRLLTCAVLLVIAAWMLVLSMLSTRGVPLLFWGALAGAITLVLGAALFFWVWWDVRDDG